MTRLMRFVSGACLCAAVLLIAACNRPSMVGINYPHARQPTLGETGDEHYQRVSRVAKHDRRLLQEDLDLFFLTDRSTRLTRWHTR